MMTKLVQQTLVKCPPAQAARRLRQFVAEHGNPDGDTARVVLGLDASLLGLPAPLRLERSVIVTMHGDRHTGDMTPRYAVAWAPEQPGPFPLFAGELQVENAEDYDAFWLVLRGSYEPPLGLVGAAFDYIVGSRIAAICARNLLTEIADSIERAFAADEARKGAASP
jgi:hypothetical protein